MARQATVAIDVEISSFRLGPNARVPAIVTPGGGGGGGGTGGSGGGGGGGTTPPRGLFGQGGLMDFAGNVAGGAGALGLRRQLISFGYLGQMLGSMGPAALAAAAAMAVLVTGIGVFIVQFKLATAVIGIFGKVMLATMMQCYQALLMLGRGFVWLAREVIGGTVRVVQWFGDKSVEALKFVTAEFRKLAEEGRKAYTELELGAAKVATVMGGIGAKAMQAREDVMKFALDMSSRTQFAAKEVSDAMYEAFSAGFEGQKSVEGLTKASLELAAATQHGTGPTMEMLAATLNTFKMNGERASEVADIFTAAIFRSAATMPKMIEAMKFAGPVAATMGMSLKETVAILEGFFQAGLKGSMAGTYFRQSIVALSKETRNAQKAFKELGVEFGNFSIMKTGGLLKSLQMLEELKNRVGKTRLNDALVQAFGARGGFGLMTLLNVGTAQIGKYMGQLNEAGLTSKAAADQLNTLSGAVKLLTNLWTNFETKLIKGTVAKSFVWLVQVLQWLVGLAESSGALGALQNVLAGVVNEFGLLVQTVGPTFINTIRDIATQIPAVVRQLGEGIAGVMPQVLAFLKWLPELFKYAFGNIIPMLISFGQTFIPLMLKVAMIVLPLLVNVLTGVGEAFVKFLQDNSGNIITWFTAFADIVENVLNLLPSLAPIINGLVNTFIEWVPALLQTAVLALPALLNAVSQVLPWLMELAYRVMPILMQGMATFANLIQTTAIRGFGHLIGALTDVATWVSANWPLLVQMLNLGLIIWGSNLNSVRLILASLLPVVANLLNYLAANWGPIWTFIGKTLKSAFGFMADLTGIIPTLAYVFGAFALSLNSTLIVLDAVFSAIASIVDLVTTGGKNLDTIWKSWAALGGLNMAILKGMGIAAKAPNLEPILRDAAKNSETWTSGIGERGAASMAPSAPGAGSNSVGPQAAAPIRVEVHQNVAWDPTKTPDQWVDTKVVAWYKGQQQRLDINGAGAVV